MDKKKTVSKTAGILTEQTELIEKIYSLQKNMYTSVLERDWLECEKDIRALDELSKKFINLDKVLYTVIKSGTQSNDIQSGTDADFFSFTNNFEKAEKEKLEILYKTLKGKIASSKIENEVFSSYITHAQILVNGILELISEERNGRCYTRAGKRVNADMKSLVLNETL